MRGLPKSSGNFDLQLDLPEKYSVEIPTLPWVIDTISCYKVVRECNRQSYEMFHLNDGPTESFPSDFLHGSKFMADIHEIIRAEL